MPLHIAHTTLMLSEAIVIESLLEAYGIRFSMAGKDITSQCPHFVFLYGGVSFLVDEEDFPDARRLIASAEAVPGYASIESDGFEARPVRNALLAFLFLIAGVPLPFWYRNAGLKSADNAAGVK